MELVLSNTTVNIGDFRKSVWKTAIDTVGHTSYVNLSQTLSLASKNALENGQPTESKVLSLLAVACSMMFTPRSVEPFKLFTGAQSRQSPALPEAFDPLEIELFAGIAQETGNVLLKARLADLVWVKCRAKKIEFAHLAIETYRKVPLTLEGDHLLCWERLLRIVSMLDGLSKVKLGALESEILLALNLSLAKDGYLALSLSKLLQDIRLTKEKRREIAGRLESLGRQFVDIQVSNCSANYAREYFDSAAQWYQKTGDSVKSAQMIACAAQASRNYNYSAPNPEFIETVLQEYLAIPPDLRAAEVNRRIAALTLQINESGRRLAEFSQPLLSPENDCTGLMETVRLAVRGKNKNEVIGRLASIYQVNLAVQNTALPDVPCFDDETINSCPDRYLKNIKFAVQSRILPALDVLHVEHRIKEDDFINCARLSHIVPEGRERLYGKGLFAGYDKDFGCALPILLPQLEHIIRIGLNQRVGNETQQWCADCTPCIFMQSEAVSQMFGEETAFEIKTLFCAPEGANLHYSVTHGSIDELQNPEFQVYAWWLALKLLYDHS